MSCIYPKCDNSDEWFALVKDRNHLRGVNATLRIEIKQLRETLQGVVTDWESLPGGRRYSPSTIETWLRGPMVSSIDAARTTLSGES